MAGRKYIELMRGNLGIDKTDPRKDNAIEAMTPEQRLGLICGWHLGDRSWARQFLDWARDCGFDVTERKA